MSVSMECSLFVGLLYLFLLANLNSAMEVIVEIVTEPIIEVVLIILPGVMGATLWLEVAEKRHTYWADYIVYGVGAGFILLTPTFLLLLATLLEATGWRRIRYLHRH